MELFGYDEEGCSLNPDERWQNGESGRLMAAWIIYSVLGKNSINDVVFPLLVFPSTSTLFTYDYFIWNNFRLS